MIDWFFYLSFGILTVVVMRFVFIDWLANYWGTRGDGFPVLLWLLIIAFWWIIAGFFIIQFSLKTLWEILMKTY